MKLDDVIRLGNFAENGTRVCLFGHGFSPTIESSQNTLTVLDFARSAIDARRTLHCMTNASWRVTLYFHERHYLRSPFWIADHRLVYAGKHVQVCALYH
jgi:hypothetical protein